MYNLTPQQKMLLQWFVEKIRERKLDEEFVIFWVHAFREGELRADAAFPAFRGTQDELSEISITQGALDALQANELIHCDIDYQSRKSGSSYESKRKCTIAGKAYEAVDTNFNAPDTSFITYLTPLADIDGFDDELKNRCLPTLGAGGSDPKLWDSATRTAAVVLEERLRDVGAISDPKIGGVDLVNKVFGKDGTLISKFTVTSEAKGYRDLYAGVFGTFRNPSAHRFIDPSPEEGGAFIVFVNLLLKKLEALR